MVLLEGRRFDAAALWDTVAAEQVNSITVVGDPFARPMLTALNEDASRDLACVRFISSSGAMFSAEVKSGLLGHLPQAVIIDLIAASEGTMGMSISTADAPAPTGQFRPSRGVMVLTEDGHPVEPGSGQAGLVALPGGAEGYYKDEAKTAATFRVLDGQRYTIPGDYATVEADGTLVLLGRGSSCINTAGEKVYPEEVEEILKALPWVEDALVFGVDDERFGQKVAAVLSRAPDTDEPLEGILSCYSPEAGVLQAASFSPSLSTWCLALRSAKPTMPRRGNFSRSRQDPNNEIAFEGCRRGSVVTDAGTRFVHVPENAVPYLIDHPKRFVDDGPKS